jgi:hypothetical protein
MAGRMNGILRGTCMEIMPYNEGVFEEIKEEIKEEM